MQTHILDMRMHSDINVRIIVPCRLHYSSQSEKMSREDTDGIFVLKPGVPDEQKVEQKNDDDRQRQHVQLKIVDDGKVNLHTVVTKKHNQQRRPYNYVS